MYEDLAENCRSHAMQDEQRNPQAESAGQVIAPAPDLKRMIARLNRDAARLLLVLLTCNGPVRVVEDLPDLMECAGLTPDEHNTHGKNPYTRAMEQLQALGFLKIARDSIRILFETAH
jgi:hypothetical protein